MTKKLNKALSNRRMISEALTVKLQDSARQRFCHVQVVPLTA